MRRTTAGHRGAGGRGSRGRTGGRAGGGSRTWTDRSRRYDILGMKVDQPSPSLSLSPLFPFLSRSLVTAAQTSSSSSSFL